VRTSSHSRQWWLSKPVLLALSCVVVLALLGGLVFKRKSVVWYVRVHDARVLLNGAPTPGYLHRSAADGSLILTRTLRDGGRQSYRIGPFENGIAGVSDCEDWTAPNLPAFPTSTYRPLCWFVRPEVGREWPADFPPRRAATGTVHSVVFEDAHGERLSASW